MLLQCVWAKSFWVSGGLNLAFFCTIPIKPICAFGSVGCSEVESSCVVKILCSIQNLQRLSRSKVTMRSVSWAIRSKIYLNPVNLIIKTRQKKSYTSIRWTDSDVHGFESKRIELTPNFDILNFGWLHFWEIWCLGHVTFFLPGFYVEVNQIWRDFVFAVSNSRSRYQFAPRWVRFWSRNHFSDFLRTPTSFRSDGF